MRRWRRALWRRLEAIHAVTYFSPEPVSALAAAGYRGYWMGYFAQRAAPLGAVGPELVSAIFYNFSPWRVAKAVPDAWSFAPPDVALEARAAGSTAALRRAFDGADIDSELATAVELAGRAARSAPLDGRPLFAANAALPWPEDPVGALWHAATLLREHRGDGHVAALIAAGVAGREAHVLQVASGATTRDVMTVARDYDDVEWQQVIDGLAERGLLTADGELTAEGRALKDDVEERTDRIALAAFATLDDDELEQLLAALTPLAQGRRRHRRPAECHADGSEPRRETVNNRILWQDSPSKTVLTGIQNRLFHRWAGRGVEVFVGAGGAQDEGVGEHRADELQADR